MNPSQPPPPPKESSVFSIKCTNCAAPLKVLGGGRVTTVTCQYCNSVLDMTDHYKVVSKFHDKYRPPVPFTLGMQGKIKDVEWTIIGWVAYKTVDFPIERWSEFFLYSPLYGYGWLIYEDGVLSFSKRVRDFSLREWYDKKTPKSLFYNKDHYVLAEEPYIVEIDFVQGELSWVAKADDKVECSDYNSIKRKSLSIEKTGQEVEVYLNEKLDNSAIYESFGVEQKRQTKAKQTALDSLFDEDSLDESEAAISTFAKSISLLVVTLLLFIVASFFSSKTLIKNKTHQPFEQMFTVSSDAFISQIDIKAPSPTVLDATRLTIYKSDKKVFWINKDHIFSQDSKFGHTWKVGDDEVKIYIKLKEGSYRASFELMKTLSPSQPLVVSVQEKIIRLSYVLPLFIIMLLIVLPTIVKNIIPPNKKKFVWWGIGGIVGVALFGAGILIFIIALYFFVQPIIDGNTTGGESHDE